MSVTLTESAAQQIQRQLQKTWEWFRVEISSEKNRAVRVSRTF